MPEQPNNLLKCTLCGKVGELWLPGPELYLCSTCARLFRLGQEFPEETGIMLAELDTGTRFRLLAGRNCPYCLSPALKVTVNCHNERYSCPVLEWSCSGCGQQWNTPISLGALIVPPFEQGDNGHAALPVPS